MVSDEDWRKAPDWDKITELKHPVIALVPASVR